MVRNLQNNDYKDYIKLISQLTSVGEVSESQFIDFVLNQNDNHRTVVYEIDGKIVGCLTYLIEQKIAHSYSSVMHIEDVVVDKEHRGKGISRILIENVVQISKKNCYKIILNCSKDNIEFYKHLGFSQSEFQMTLRNYN